MGIRRRPRIKVILILLLLILLGAGAGIFFYIRHLTGSTNYMSDEDVTAVQPVSESEAEPPVTAASLYDLSGVSPVPAALLENTYTLLVIGGDDSPDVPEDETEHVSGSAFSVSEEASSPTRRQSDRMAPRWVWASSGLWRS